MRFDPVHSPPPTNPTRSTSFSPSSKLMFCFVFFFLIFNGPLFTICSSCLPGCGVIHWSVGDSSSPRGCQLSIVPQLGMGVHESPHSHAGMLTGLALCRPPQLLWVPEDRVLLCSGDISLILPDLQLGNKFNVFSLCNSIWWESFYIKLVWCLVTFLCITNASCCDPSTLGAQQEVTVHSRLGWLQSDLLGTPTSPQVFPCQHKYASGSVNAPYGIGMLSVIPTVGLCRWPLWPCYPVLSLSWITDRSRKVYSFPLRRHLTVGPQLSWMQITALCHHV